MKGNQLQKTRGITMIGFIIVLAVLGIFAFVGMKLFPAYSEFYGVSQAMNALKMEPSATTMDQAKIRDLLGKKFYISYVKSVKPEDIKIKKSSGVTTVSVAYEVREPMIYNLDFVAKFEKSIQLSR